MEDVPPPRHLLQPQRDLVANWSVDVARELQAYLIQLSRTGDFADGQTLLNFAEAALVIQGSIQVYSRKVEYLYALVLQALDAFLQKKVSQPGKSSLRADGKDVDVAEEVEEEEEFLSLDDVPEEANIDIDDEGVGAGLLSTAAKPPTCLVVVEGEARDEPGDAGELAAYQIATSTLHRDFLLLDPSDALSVDNYLGCNGGGKTGSRARTPKGKSGTPGTRQGSVAKSRTPRSVGPAMDGEEGADEGVKRTGRSFLDGTPGADDMNSAWPVNSLERAYDGDGGVGADGGSLSDKETESDPWAPLNPHEMGSLPVKPYKKGSHFRQRKPRRKAVPGSTALDTYLASRNSVSFPEFAKALQARQHEDEAAVDSFARRYDQLRNSFVGSENKVSKLANDNRRESAGSGAPDSSDDVDDVPSMQFDDILDNHGDMERGEPEGPKPDDAPLPRVPKAQEDLSFEDLCQAHMDSILQKLHDCEERSELATRVSTWKQKIEATLGEQERRTPFDIHAYGENLLHTLSSNTDGNECLSASDKPFTDLVQGQAAHEVARSFSALLQLVNNGNVEIEGTSSSPFCFTAQNCFAVKFLSRHRQLEEMLQYVAPSRMKKKKKKKEEEEESSTKRAALLDISNACSPSSLSSARGTSDKKRRAISSLDKSLSP